MTPLEELATRCEAASGNDAELFLDVFRAMFPKPEQVWVTDNNGPWTPEYADWSKRQDEFYEFVEVGAFNDAAMTLIPEDCCLHQMGNVPDNPPSSKWWAALWREGDEEDLGEVNACTSALVIAAACLKARAMEASNG